MALSPGERLGPYEILAPIGAGGMGQVWKARDTRLDRIVAIKVLPEHIAKREDLQARFEREARAVASLNHPNICVVHDIGSQDGHGFMVMEFMEGETLGARIAKGALPLEQALKYAVQIADALDRAHRAGVTHRDVKPANIMLTRDGVKLLDFGLAKSTPTLGSDEKTLVAGLTTEGTILGTPQYMAPEQFSGKEADARADIWAFGAVLYEMVTGRKAFQGKDYQSLLGAILATEPPPMSVEPFTPVWLERLVRRCLEKDPEERYQSMRDVVIDLRMPPPESATAASAKVVRWPFAVAGATTLALIIAGAGWYNATRPAPLRPLIRLDMEIPSETPLVRGAIGISSTASGNMLALSPDGKRLVATLLSPDGKVRLYTRLLDQSQFTALAGTDGATFPFFSPAGDWIAFFAEGKLKKIAVEGGAAVTLCDASFGLGGSWGDDGNIIAALQFSTGTLFRVPSIGGTPVAVTKMNPGEITHRFPQVLPGSQAVLFTVASEVSRSAFDSASLDLLMLKTGERKTILKGGFFPRYVAGTIGSNGTGHIVYVHQATLFAVPFDLDRLSTNGSSVPILEDVDSSSSGGGDITFAQNGTVAYHPGRASIGGSVISWVDSSAKTSPLHAPPGEYTTLRFSPDGKRLAFSITSGDASDIWVKELDRDSPSRLSFLPGRNDNPVWTPDGRHIVFRSTNPAASGLYGIRSDGSSEAKRLTEGKQGESPGSFSPDGKRLAIVQTGDGSQADIFTMPAETDSGTGTFGLRLGKAELFLGTPFRETNPRFSPDGRWLAYISNESGKSEVYVRPFPGPGGKWQISTGPGSAPRWSRDGRELLYLGQRGDVMAVSYTAQNGAFAAGKPRVWSEARLSLLSATYDIAPDGKRLAAIALGQSEVGRLPRPQLTFLLNFIDELRRKAPAGK